MNGWEIILIGIIAVFLLGPDRLPDYTGKAVHWIRQLRIMAENAKVELKEQLGPEYEDINWRQYDPRQYDPRRIVREALLDPIAESTADLKDDLTSLKGDLSSFASGSTSGSGAAGSAASGSGASIGASTVAGAAGAAAVGAAGTASPGVDPRRYDPSRPTPYDSDAT